MTRSVYVEALEGLERAPTGALDAIRAAVAKADAEGKRESDLGWTFVADRLPPLPVRPKRLGIGNDGRMCWSVTVAQCRKMLAYANGEAR